MSRYIAPAVLKVIEPTQFGAIPNSHQALVSMIHEWAKVRECTSAAVRLLCCLTILKLSTSLTTVFL